MSPARDRPGHVARRLRRQRALASLALWFEALWPALWPPLGLAGAFLCLALFGLPQLLPPWPHAILIAAFAIAIIGLLLRGVLRLPRPRPGAADRRLETAAGLSHRPLTTLADQPAVEDPVGQALWHAHLARSMAAIGRLRVGMPRPGLAARDRRALRGLLVVALVAGFVVAGNDAGPRFHDALVPDFAPASAAAAPQVQAWITPPAYTGVAPLFLHAEGGAVSVPAGSRLTISVTGGSGEPVLSFAGHEQAFRTLAAGSFQAERDLATGGRLIVRRHGSAVANWDVTAIADTPPIVAFDGTPGRAPRGLQTRLPWKAQDDYGVVSLQAELRLKDRPDAPPLVIAVPLSGHPRTARGVALPDLTAHPWAGLPVVARLVGHDAPGQTGTSADAIFDLPERHFENLVARAIIAIRKQLSLHPEDREAALRGLGMIAADPDAFNNDAGVFLNLAALGGLLLHDLSPQAIDEAQRRMWQLALYLEEGAPERTARALEAARQAVHEALDRTNRDAREHPERLSKDQQDLQRRLDALRQAIQQHLQALAEQARREGAMQPFDPNQQHLSNQDIDRMAQSIEQAARQGRMQDAQQQLAQLEQLLNQLKNARIQPGQGQRNAEQQQRGRQQMGAVQDLAHRQAGLLDKSQAREQPDSNASDSNSAAQRKTDARVQGALRKALGELMQQFGDLTGKIPSELGEADQAMRDAGQALSQGQDAAAGAAQQRAVEALQKGGQQMAEQMARQFGLSSRPGEGQGNGLGLSEQDDGQERDGRGYAYGRNRGGDRQDVPRDPLGRPLQEGGNGTDESSDVRVPDQMEQARSRAIQEELRRRGAERTRPQEELQYIDRLLKAF